MASFEQSFAELLSALHEENPEVGVLFEAVATNIIDIRNFYIVPWRRYKLRHIIEKPGEIMKNYEEHSLVNYLSTILARNVRGIVRQVNLDGSCTIYAMDYGIIDTNVTAANIFHLLNSEAENIPGLACFCELSMCYPRNSNDFSQEAIDCFKFFMGSSGEKLNITVREIHNQKLGVLVMSSKSNPDDISASLAYCYYSTFFSGSVGH